MGLWSCTYSAEGIAEHGIPLASPELLPSSPLDLPRGRSWIRRRVCCCPAQVNLLSQSIRLARPELQLAALALRPSRREFRHCSLDSEASMLLSSSSQSLEPECPVSECPTRCPHAKAFQKVVPPLQVGFGGRNAATRLKAHSSDRACMAIFRVVRMGVGGGMIIGHFLHPIPNPPPPPPYC